MFSNFNCIIIIILVSACDIRKFIGFISPVISVTWIVYIWNRIKVYDVEHEIVF